MIAGSRAACRCAMWRTRWRRVGAEAALSKSTVSWVCEASATKFDAVVGAALDEGVGRPGPGRFMLKMHAGARPSLRRRRGGSRPKARRCSWPWRQRIGSTDAWVTSSTSWSAAVAPSSLVISDRAAGLINAAETALPVRCGSVATSPLSH